MTEDDISRGLSRRTSSPARRTRPSTLPAISSRPSRPCRPATTARDELWKFNHYYERLDEWNAAHGIAKNPFAGPAAEPFFELHNLTTDPEERHNHAADDKARPLPHAVRAGTQRGCQAQSSGQPQPQRIGRSGER